MSSSKRSNLINEQRISSWEDEPPEKTSEKTSEKTYRTPYRKPSEKPSENPYRRTSENPREEKGKTRFPIGMDDRLKKVDIRIGEHRYVLGCTYICQMCKQRLVIPGSSICCEYCDGTECIKHSMECNCRNNYCKLNCGRKVVGNINDHCIDKCCKSCIGNPNKNHTPECDSHFKQQNPLFIENNQQGAPSYGTPSYGASSSGVQPAAQVEKKNLSRTKPLIGNKLTIENVINYNGKQMKQVLADGQPTNYCVGVNATEVFGKLCKYDPCTNKSCHFLHKCNGTDVVPEAPVEEEEEEDEEEVEVL